MIIKLISGVAFDGALVAVGCHALARGGRPEKIGALVFVVATLASTAARLSGVASWDAGGPTLWIDAATMALFYWLGCRTRRFWPIWVFGMLICIVLIDIVKIAMPGITRLTFQNGQVLYAYLALALLSVGIVVERAAADNTTSRFRPRC